MNGRLSKVLAGTLIVVAIAMVAVAKIPSPWQAPWNCSMNVMLDGKPALNTSWCRKAIGPPG